MLGAAAGDRPSDFRDRAILRLVAVYGLRSGEVRILHVEDIDWEAEALRVLLPKTGRTQVYLLARSVSDTVLCYLREERPPRNLSDIPLRTILSTYAQCGAIQKRRSLHLPTQCRPSAPLC